MTRSASALAAAVDEPRLVAGEQQADGDPGAHRPGTDHRDAGRGPGGSWIGQPTPFREEEMSQRAGLGRPAAGLERRARLGRRVAERQVDRRLDHVHDHAARRHVARAFRQRIAHRVASLERRRARGGAVADTPHRTALLHQGFGVGDRRVPHVALEGVIDESERARALGTDRFAAEHHREGGRGVDHPRQPHATAGARQQPELDLGKTQGEVVRGGTIVAGEGEFGAAAERRPVQRADDRLVQLFDVRKHVVQQRRTRVGVELADVGAGHERTADAVQHDRLHLRIGSQRLDGGKQRRAHRLRERVDGWMVDLDHADVARPSGLERTDRRRHVTRSISIAMPCPTPTHIVHRARR
jgi:hypothetical protein